MIRLNDKMVGYTARSYAHRSIPTYVSHDRALWRVAVNVIRTTLAGLTIDGDEGRRADIYLAAGHCRNVTAGHGCYGRVRSAPRCTHVILISVVEVPDELQRFPMRLLPGSSCQNP